MPAAPLSLDYDSDRWIHVPLDYLGTQWTDAGEWAAWLADEATRGREAGPQLHEAVRAEALATALFPAAHVSFRFWHYPADSEPSGFADVYVQARRGDGAPSAELLPELGFTAVAPVVESVAAPHLIDPVRRLSLGIALPDEDAEPVLLPRAEWLGTTDAAVCYVVSSDHDVNALNRRLADIDALFAAIDPAGTAG